MYRYILIGLLFTSSLISANNSISGFVLNKTTNEPLAFANVVIKGTTYKTTTDYSGKFNFPEIQNGTYSIIVSYSGFLTYETVIDLNIETEFTFYLEETCYDINAIVITGTRTEKMLKNSSVLTQIITSDDLKYTDAVDIKDALSIAMPSVDFNNTSAGTTMKMLGLEAKYILFLIDGEKIAGETNGNIDFDRINTDNIERIEIIKGASSSLYGSNAIGGVINIITKNADRPLETNIGTRYSVFNNGEQKFFVRDYKGSIGINHKKINSKTNFYRKIDDGFELLNESDNNIELASYNILNLKQKFSYVFNNKLKLSINGNYYQRERFNTTNIPSHKKDFQISYGSKFYYIPNNKFNVSLSYFSDRYETLNIDEIFNNQETSLYINKFENARIIGNYKAGKYQLVTIGTEYIKDKLFSLRVQDENKSIYNSVIYIQDDINFKNKLNLTAGIRANYHSSYGLHTVPQMSIMYKLKMFNLRGTYGLGFKSPTMKELYMDFSPVPIVEVLGNPNLIPESSNYYSASVEFSKPAINTSVTFYQNRVKNMITEVQDISNPVIWTYMNIDEVKITGIDFMLRAKLKYNLSITTSYSFTDSEDQSRSKQLIGVSKNSAMIIFGYIYKRVNYKANINIRAKYIDALSFEEMDEITGESEVKYFDPYTLWKITLTQQIYKGFDFTLSVDNIFNYSEPQNITTLNPGRSLIAGINIYINKIHI